MVIVTLPMSEAVPAAGEDPGVPALPIVQKATIVKREGGSGYYSVHFTRNRFVVLFQFAPGKFIVTRINGQGIRNRLPESITWGDFLRSAAGRKWRHWRVRRQGEAQDERVQFTQDVPEADATDEAPWSHEGMTITMARPTLPSVCGERRARTFLANTVEVSR
jgi:hypothetical protein